MINACILLLNPELKLEKRIKIRVEPGIFEWTKWEAGKAAPTLMSLEELREANFNVSMDYRYAASRRLLLGVSSRSGKIISTLVKDGKNDFIQEGALQWGFAVGERERTRLHI